MKADGSYLLATQKPLTLIVKGCENLISILKRRIFLWKTKYFTGRDKMACEDM